MTAKEQNKLAGIFLMIHGGIHAVTMLFIALIYGGIGTVMFARARRQEEQFVGAVMAGLVVFFVIFAVLVVIPQLVGGWKMIKERPNARVWGIVGSIVACLSFPLGTAAGVFGLVFLFGDAGRQFYLGGGGPVSFQPPQPPPPSSWQS